MKSVMLRLNGAEDIQRFVSAVASYENDIDLRKGRYVVDGKSLMGIFSLDLSTPVEAIIYGTGEDELIRKLSGFLAES